jgi:putative DNA primase/helicase
MPDDGDIAAQIDQLRQAASNPAAEDDDSIPPLFTDESLALRFTQRHMHELRYVAPWGKWMIWTGKVWAIDNTKRVFDLARAICRQAAAECPKDSTAANIASAKTVAAVERLAQADRHHAATVDQWDADPLLLNTPAGIVDLRTGKMMPHDPKAYLTKITAVPPTGDCPQWRRFLDRITNGDKELQAYLQRVAGYGLTGITREHAMFDGYGTGANGKGTFLNAVTGVMGDYAAVAQMETFTASFGDRHPTELAMLRGARFVTAQETEEGRRWAESRIKALTGGDPITARFMRQDFFTFTPRFKLFIVGNHKPALRSVDEAIRRRLNLIPFNVTIPPEERDPDLPEKLRAEWPGILAWAIQGCLQWQELRISPPAAVLDATTEYLDGEDAMGLWIAECCKVAPGRYDTTAALFASWKQWAEQAGEFVGSQKRFSQALQSRGFSPQRQAMTGKAGFNGIAVKPLQSHRQPNEQEDEAEQWHT